MTPVQLSLWAVLGLALAVSVFTDLRLRRVLDWVTYPAWALLLALRFFASGLGDAEEGLLSGVLASGGAAALFSIWALRGRMGWGDVKLVGVVGAALGFPLVLAALLFISLAGAAQALLSLLVKGETTQWLRERMGPLLVKLRLRTEAPSASSRHIPYAVAIALGSACALWWDSAV